MSTRGHPHKRLGLKGNLWAIDRVESICRGRRTTLSVLAATAVLGLAGCAREPEPPRYATAYPGQPVQTVTGTNYAAYPGLPAPPPNAEGIVPPPPPRYMGSSTTASSANVGAPDVRRDVRGCTRSGLVIAATYCE